MLNTFSTYTNSIKTQQAWLKIVSFGQNYPTEAYSQSKHNECQNTNSWWNYKNSITWNVSVLPAYNRQYENTKFLAFSLPLTETHFECVHSWQHTI